MAFMEKKSWSDVGMALVYCSSLAVHFTPGTGRWNSSNK
ncbi:hypothetical protein FORC81_p442 (plasmid) [Escherichia coli]|nr:hypothetical protein FORC81_p442 [Escherichia coli]